MAENPFGTLWWKKISCTSLRCKVPLREAVSGKSSQLKQIQKMLKIKMECVIVQQSYEANEARMIVC